VGTAILKPGTDWMLLKPDVTYVILGQKSVYEYHMIVAPNILVYVTEMAKEN